MDIATNSARISTPALAPVGLAERPQATSAATELPARKVVTAAAASAGPAPADDPGNASGADGRTTHRVLIDPDTRQIVSQTVDTTTHEVLGQLPDRTLLGLRAYLDGLARAHEGDAANLAAGRHVLPALVA